MKNRMELKVSFVKTFHKTIDKLFTNVYNMSCKNFIKKLNIPLRRSRLSGKMETTCPDRRKPL